MHGGSVWLRLLTLTLPVDFSLPVRLLLQPVSVKAEIMMVRLIRHATAIAGALGVRVPSFKQSPCRPPRLTVAVALPSVCHASAVHQSHSDRASAVIQAVSVARVWHSRELLLCGVATSQDSAIH